MDAVCQRHVFFCLNQRDAAYKTQLCCASANAVVMYEHARKLAKARSIIGPGLVRINKSGCLGRCSLGPVFVVYPEGIWYTYLDEDDINEIVDSHLVDGRVVERLEIDP